MAHDNSSDSDDRGLASDLDHPLFADWQYEVTDGSTSRGFRDWLAVNEEAVEMTTHFVVSTRAVSTMRVSDALPGWRECSTTGRSSKATIEGSYDIEGHPEHDPTSPAYDKADLYDTVISGLAREVTSILACFTAEPAFDDLVDEFVDLHKFTRNKAEDKARRIQHLLRWFSELTADEHAELDAATVEPEGYEGVFGTLTQSSIKIRSHNAAIRELREARTSLQRRRAALTPWLTWNR